MNDNNSPHKTSPPSNNHSAADLVNKRSGRRAIAAASVGNALEWYDFSVYAFFALYIARNFFNPEDGNTHLFEAFLAFGVGFIIRPLGALLIGNYADRSGRKAALTMTIMIMAIGTGIIAFAPPYSAIGIGAPILLLCGRVLQGFSVGGEVGGAAAFLIEHSPKEHRGLYASWLQASMAISNILGALVASTVTLLFDDNEISEWAWRIPFILGLSIAPVGLWMRRTLSETPLFTEQQRTSHIQNKQEMPIFRLFRQYPKALLLGTGLSILWAVSVYSMIIYLPIYVRQVIGFSSHHAFLAALIGNCFMVIGCLLAGKMADKIGTQKILVFGSSLLLICSYPLLVLLDHFQNFTTLVIVQSLLCILVSLFAGVAPGGLSQLFPTAVRSSGMSIAYNLAVTIFGGFAPAILTWFAENTGTRFAPAWYVMLASITTLITLFFIHRYSEKNASPRNNKET